MRKGEEIMKILTTLFTIILLFNPSFSLAEPQDTYVDCLKSSFSGHHHLSAAEVRSLCEEISGTNVLSYKGGKDKMTPNNKFTICYDKEKKNLQPLGGKRAGEIAKIVCRYEAR